MTSPVMKSRFSVSSSAMERWQTHGTGRRHSGPVSERRRSMRSCSSLLRICAEGFCESWLAGFPLLGMAFSQARKSLRLCLARLGVGWFDPIAEVPELPEHSGRALLLGLLGDGWAPFFVTNSLMQDQPDQSTLSMGNSTDRLVVSQAGDRAPIHDFEDASFGPGCGVGSLIE